MKRILSLLTALALLTALVAGCSGSAKNSSPMESGSGGVARDMAGPAPAATPAPGAPAQKAAPPMAPGASGGVNAPPLVSDNRKIIQNAQFDMKVKNTEDAVAKIGQAVRAGGGFVQEARQQGTKPQGRTVMMTLRVPAGQYGAMVDLVTSMGEVANRREWTDDVTEQYVDTEARIRSKELHLKQLQTYYAKGGNIKEMLELEAEINRVTSDLESLQGRMRVLKDRVELSTFIVNLYEPAAPAPIKEPETVIERIKVSFIKSWNGVVNFTGDLIVFLIGSLPVLIYLAIFGFAGYWIVRSVLKFGNRFRKPPSA